MLGIRSAAVLIDVHGHIGRDTPPSRVGTYAGVCGVDWVLVSNRDAAVEPAGAANVDETDANVACLEACRARAHLVPLYWVRPGRTDSNLHALAGALDSEPFAGVVFCPCEGGFDVSDPQVEPYLRILGTVGRPGLFCIGRDPRAAPAKVYEQARRQPRTPIVLCGCGAGEAERDAMLDVARQAQRRQDANLYVDTSHAGAAKIRTAVKLLGAERVLFGTDALRYGDSHVPRHITLLEELRGSMPPADLDQVTGGNAVRLFGLRRPKSK